MSEQTIFSMFSAAPLSEAPLSLQDRARWLSRTDAVMRHAHREVDWGTQSQLGMLFTLVAQVREQLRAVEPAR